MSGRHGEEKDDRQARGRDQTWGNEALTGESHAVFVAGKHVT